MGVPINPDRDGGRFPLCVSIMMMQVRLQSSYDRLAADEQVSGLSPVETVVTMGPSVLVHEIKRSPRLSREVGGFAGLFPPLGSGGLPSAQFWMVASLTAMVMAPPRLPTASSTASLRHSRRWRRWRLQSVVSGNVMYTAPLPVGLDGDGPVLVGALLSPLGLQDVAADDGEGVVADPFVTGFDVLAEAQVEGELTAADVAGRYVAEAGGEEHGRCLGWRVLLCSGG